MKRRPRRKAIEVVPRDGKLPLSYAQQRMWFLYQLNPDGSYHLPAVWRLRGLDEQALGLALTAILERHEVLRTVFANDGGTPRVRILEPGPWDLPIIDLTDLDSDEQEKEVERKSAEEFTALFDLERGVVRAQLLRLSKGEHILLVTMHHIAADGWSFGVFWHEVQHFYEAFATKHPPELRPLPIQYLDYARWQRESQAEELEPQLAYWKTQLAGAPEEVTLPYKGARPAMQTSAGKKLHQPLSIEESHELHALCQRSGTTLHMTLMAAFRAVLSRYSGQLDICLGTVVAGRNRAKLRPLIGCFINSLVFRNALQPDDTFANLLERERIVALAAYANQDAPFEQVVERLDLSRDLSRNPLFQVMYIHQNTPTSEETPFLEAELLWGSTITAEVDLKLQSWEMGERIDLGATYNSDLFDSWIMEQLLTHLRTFLKCVCRDPAQPLAKIEFLSDEERHTQLEVWNDTKADFGDFAAVHELFERQVDKTPDSVALRFEGESMSYAELDRQANQVARYLIEQGVSREDQVGLLLERSFDMQIAIFGIMKAGAAYVPIDPRYPVERIQAVVEDSGARIVVGHSKWAERIAALGLQTIWLDTLTDTLGLQDSGRLGISVDPDQLVYTLFTSGSTGRPKGVMVSHEGLTNEILWLREDLQVGDDEVVLQKTPYTFDPSGWEFFVPFVAGASLVYARPEGHKEPDYLADLMQSEKISLLQFVPTMLQLFLDSERHDAWATVRKVITVGEALPVALRDAFHARSEAELINIYGPTEATIGASVWHCERDTPIASVPIGHPTSNIQFYVLDASMQLVPTGVTGELFIGGEVAKGYIGRPELTAERFIPNPFGAATPIYKTGDLVRYRPDGALEYMGRADDQIKLRGFRVELGEIRAILEEHASVAHCAVITRKVGGSEQLVAYVVSPDGEIDRAVLQAHLAEKLPSYMVPALYVQIEEVPFNANGKLDRKALPAPEHTGASERVAATTPTQIALAEIWCDFLQLEEVGITDSFFALGGHSLLAMRVLAHIAKQFGASLSVTQLFGAPTIEALARLVDGGQGDVVGQEIEVVSRDGELPLSFAQQRMWFLYQLNPSSGSYHLPAAWRLRGLDEKALGLALSAIIERHEVLRTVFTIDEGMPKVRILEPGPWDLPVIDLTDLDSDAQEKELERRSAEAFTALFDLERGPLARAQLLRLNKDEHILLVTMHHIASDGWSFGVFWHEVQHLYEAFATKQPPRLPPLPIQYLDYASWQRTSKANQLETQLAYWKTQLAGAPEEVTLPYKGPRPTQQTSAGDAHGLSLSVEESRALLALCQRSGTTLHMTLMAAFRTILSRYSGQLDICIGTVIAGRNRTELEPLIGFFVNTLVFRNALQPDDTFVNLLERERDVALDAYANQDAPFEQIIEVLDLSRDLSRNPLFQVMYVHQNTPRENNAPFLEAQPLWGTTTTAEFDLKLQSWEAEDRIGLSLTYNTDLFEPWIIEQLLTHLRTLIQCVCRDPAQPLAKIEFLSAEERNTQLVEWNDTKADFGDFVAVHELFEKQVDKTPDAVALRFEGESMSYAELDERANQLARYLCGQGVVKGDLIGLLIERSFEMQIAVFAILKAGAAYIPIDPQYPNARISAVVEQSGTRMVVGDSQWSEGIAGLGLQTIWLDQLADTLCELGSSRLAISTDPEQLANVLFTSGSTGRPKGVMISHANVRNALFSLRKTFKLDASDVHLQKLPFTFDVSIWELLGPFIDGARLVYAKPGGHMEPAYLADLIRREKVTVTFMVPAMLQILLDSSTKDDWQSFTRMLVGGDVLPSALPSAFAAKCDGEFYNVYGPTETTIMNCDWLVDPSTSATSFPIGRPQFNSQYYVLDSSMQLLPVGVVGEVCIGGAQVSRGYIGRPDLTAERYVPNPFGAPGTRLYKTGDLVKYRPDGALEFVGRADGQIQLRGLRIEIGEIESVLESHPAVARCAVTTRKVAGTEQLVAYVVAPEGEIDRAVLQAHLAEKLPSYMVPAFYVTMDELPLGNSGKVNRKALPAPEQTGASERVAATTPTQITLAEIWCDLLQLGEVGITDNFFALGGHSLLAMRMLGQLAERLNATLSLAQIFGAPTIEALALLVDRDQSASGSPVVAPRLCATTVQRYPTNALNLHYIERSAALERLTGSPGASTICTSWRVSAPCDTTILHRALEAVSKRHESLRTCFVEVRGTTMQEFRPDMPVKLEAAELPAGADAIEYLASLKLNSIRPNRATGPLLHVHVLLASENEHYLTLAMDHAVSDGASMDVILRDLTECYNTMNAGDEWAVLPVVQAGDLALREESFFHSEDSTASKAYFQNNFVPSPPAFMPSRPEGHVAIVDSSVWVDVSENTLRAIEALAKHTASSPFAVCLAMFAIYQHRESGLFDFRISSAHAARSEEGLNDAVGCISREMPSRIRLDPACSFEAFVRKVWKTYAADLSHMHVSSRRALAESQAPFDFGNNTYSSVMLYQSWEGGENSELDGPHMERILVPTEEGSSDHIGYGLQLFVFRQTLVFQFDSRIFTKKQATAGLEFYRRLMEEAPKGPTLPVSQLLEL